jgi:predicted site-specific integrase-resolvase
MADGMKVSTGRVAKYNVYQDTPGAGKRQVRSKSSPLLVHARVSSQKQQDGLVTQIVTFL